MDASNKKILFFVHDYHHYQAYIQGPALSDVRDSIVFVVAGNLKHLDFGVPAERVYAYSFPDRKDILHRHIFNINTWIHRNKNIGFHIRTLLFTPRQKRIYRIFALPVISRIVKFIFLARARDRKLYDLVKEVNPDIIVIPSHAFEGTTFELIRIGTQLCIPSFMMVDNWDTLVWKTTFTFKPDYLGVWSKQQIEHAVKVRGMPRDKIFILGAPRFINYLNPEQKKLPPLYPFRYILYVGVFDEFDELTALKKIDEAIEKFKVPFKVVFRPTATQFPRKCPDVFFEYDYKHVILDTHARTYYKKGTSWDFSKDKFDPKQFPDPNYNLSLLQNAEYIICPQSTMLLEATMLGQKVYLVAYDDGIHRFNPKWTFEKTAHLHGLERLENIRMVRNKEDIEKIFLPGDQLKKTFDEPVSIDFFIAQDQTKAYPSNLKKIIDMILESKA
ncbi:MAG: hypothetical protein HY506_01945 [Candidatus Yanofskybacteria bacterium]|nr:hypothetical protein [Candidatus Yanofskybacteria bacterium]